MELSESLKIIWNYIMFILMLASCIYLAYAIDRFYEFSKETDVHIGQLWRYTAVQEDPFKDDVYYDLKVIAVSEDYVQYIQNDKDTLSSKKVFFKYCELIKDNNQ